MVSKSLVWRIDRIVDNVSIYDFFVWIGRPIQPRSRPHQISCPFKFGHAHGDMHPSARIFPDSNKIHCFTEAKSRDIIDAVSEYYGITLLQAVTYIERKKGWKLRIQDKISRQIRKAKIKKREKKYIRDGNIPEENILELVVKIRSRLTKNQFKIMEGVVIYLWDIYDGEQIRKASFKKQVEWERWAKGHLKLQLQVVKDVAQFKNPTVEGIKV
ncbi:MAG TPA: hypothetical protein ENH85_12925 [Candidatus Scalindua sp.]|nr:hypothetical protein [Candidatus Scalindua sp.]